MACSGLRACDITLPRQLCDTDQTERMIYLAHDMKKYVSDKSLKEGSKMSIKIGIHYGRVIAGVIGYHKPQFSLIGDTINTASRVCSTSDSLFITISESAYERIKGNSSFSWDQKIVEVFISFMSFIYNFIKAKGKGAIKTYQLTKIKENQKYDPSYHSINCKFISFSYKNTLKL